MERMVSNNANKRMGKVYMAERNLQHLIDYLCDCAKDLGIWRKMKLKLHFWNIICCGHIAKRRIHGLYVGGTRYTWFQQQTGHVT